MKNIILIAILLLGSIGFAQTSIAKSNKSESKIKFESNSVVFDQGTKQFLYTGNVYIKTGKLEVINADRVIYDQITQQIIVVGGKEFTIDGAIQFSGTSKTKRLRYTIGDSIAYLE